MAARKVTGLDGNCDVLGVPNDPPVLGLVFF